jgi:Fic family protein
MKPLKRVVIKEELVVLTGDFRPAIILNQFIYWIERMKDTDRYILEEKERASKEQLEVSMDESNGWIYKTAEELNEELMVGMSKATIGKYINQLVEAGYLAKRNNPKYKWDKTLQYRVDLVKVQKDLAKLGYALEGYKLLPNIEIVDVDVEVKENKKASSTAIDEAPQTSTSINNSYNKSIPQKDKKDTKKIKKVSETLQVIKDSCVSIKKQDLNECEELFTDIDRLKLALEICENNNSNGIKALKLAYKKAYTQNNNSNDNFTNNFSKGAGSGVNNNFAKYGNDLEAILQKSQEGKFKDMEQGIGQFNPSFKL